VQYLQYCSTTNISRTLCEKTFRFAGTLTRESLKVSANFGDLDFIFKVISGDRAITCCSQHISRIVLLTKFRFSGMLAGDDL